MTREEALVFLYSIASNFGFTDVEYYTCKDGEKMREAIKVINQEPCTDAISRQAAIVALDDRMSSLENVDIQIAMGFAKGIIHELPPVTPMPKMARWVIEEIDGCKHAICSNCGDDSYLSPEWDALELYRYCPNCGAKMENEI